MSTVLVTGASRGLGLEFCRQYRDDGWQVIAAFRSPSAALEALQADSPDRIELMPLDVASDASIDALKDRLSDRPIDVLLNNAGTMGKANFAESGLEDSAFGLSDAEDWANVFRTNIYAPVRVAEKLVENVAASSQKKIITLSSMLGSMELNTVGGLYAYRASKAGVNAVMKSMAIDLARRGIIAAPIHPGWVRTELGGPQAALDVEPSVRGVREVIATLDAERAGRLWAWDGSEMPW